MVVEAIYDRQIRDIVGKLLAYQRDAPIHVRILSPIIHETELSDGEKLSEKIKKLIKFKDARVTLLVNSDFMKNEKEIELLRVFEDMGVRIHCKKDLHAKAILLDSKRDKGILVTSANLTPTGLGKQNEIGIYILNDLDHVFKKIYDYVTNLLKETNVNIRGDYHASMV
jgi:phosphatidylserine/phosphatidylglycerophosphate/cardiolipin synthase-like enzyme